MACHTALPGKAITARPPATQPSSVSNTPSASAISDEPAPGKQKTYNTTHHGAMRLTAFVIFCCRAFSIMLLHSRKIAPGKDGVAY